MADLHKMNITVVLNGDKSAFQCEPTDTLLSLKEQIESDEGIEPKKQTLFFHGYWISEDSLLLGDFLKDADELTLSLPTAALTIKKFENLAQKDVWVVNGSKHRFTMHLVPRTRNIPIKLKSKLFGIVYHTEGTKQGERKYQVLRYDVEDFDKVELKTIDGNVEVILDGSSIEPTDSGVFDEARNKTKMELAKVVSKIGVDVAKFLRGVAALVYPGFRLAIELMPGEVTAVEGAEGAIEMEIPEAELPE
eukprot:TRINITY_DN10059_c0_g1_i1.p1 TRINITY_DN10059_c0_g1~~TRINITY_DN10059_c0_g1_i1.p1  ORF type:complete len:249 (-),score=56.61 TRINITY_DN10059_c0_g1_i1:88-834(-)